MRIVFVTSEYVTEQSFDGGLANYLGRVCPMLAQMGHEVIVVVASDRQGELVQDGVEVQRVAINSKVSLWINKCARRRFKATASWLSKSWAFSRVCAKIHRKRPIDLIQYASFSATGLFRLKDVPAVVRISSFEPLWQKAYGWPINLDNRLRAWLEKIALKNADAVFGPSRSIAEVVAKAVSRPVAVIEPPFSLDDAGWDSQPYLDLIEGKKYILFFGTLGELKGVSTIAEVVRPFLQNHPEYLFVFVGKDFGSQGRSMIEYVWEKAGPLRYKILYLGQMRHAQLYPILAHATVVLLPSRVDNLPNACLEAMALKRIVVGTRGASFEQLIKDGESGFLISPDAPTELLGTVEKAITLSESARERMGKIAAERIKTLCPEKTVAQLIDFYTATISSWRN